jgi:hypothetical protein
MRAPNRPPSVRICARAVAAIVVAALSCLSICSAVADGRDPRFELTPYVGYRIGGEFEQQNGSAKYELDEGNSAGLIFNIVARDVNTQWQVLYGQQRTSHKTPVTFDPSARLGIDVEYFQFGGTYLFDGDDMRPFIALTAGVTHFGPTLAGVDSESFFSGSIGGGVQLLQTSRVGVRLEARVFTTFVSTDGAIFCHSGPNAGGCAISIHGTALYQFEASAGVVFRF